MQEADGSNNNSETERSQDASQDTASPNEGTSKDNSEAPSPSPSSPGGSESVSGGDSDYLSDIMTSAADGILDEGGDDSKDDPEKQAKRKLPLPSKTEQKKMRYTNEPFVDTKGNTIESKQFKDFRCICKRKCHRRVSFNKRKEIFEAFWSLGSYDAQILFIGKLVEEMPKKRQYGNNSEKRKFSRIYRLNDTKVCHEMFCRTLSISSSRVNTAMKKVNNRAAMTDQRGKNRGGFNRLSEEKVDVVVHHINKILMQHLQKDEDDGQLLPPGMTLLKMYGMYTSEVEQPVSLSMYKKVFYDLKPFHEETDPERKELLDLEHQMFNFLQQHKGERKVTNIHAIK